MFRLAVVASVVVGHANNFRRRRKTTQGCAGSGSGRALLVVDAQNCFTNDWHYPGTGSNTFVACDNVYKNPPDQCERNGTLGVSTGMPAIEKINEVRNACDETDFFQLVVRTQDWHTEKHVSFASTHFGDNPFNFSGGPVPSVGYEVTLHCTDQSNPGVWECCLVDVDQDACNSTNLPTNKTCTAGLINNSACTYCANAANNCTTTTQGMWTDHCIQNTDDADFHRELVKQDTDFIVQKGDNAGTDSYSAFLGNLKEISTTLLDKLNAENITEVWVAGIALDFCVYFTADDAKDFNFTTHVISDASAAIGIPTGSNTTTATDAVADMVGNGITMTDVSTVVATCEQANRRRRSAHRRRRSNDRRRR